MSVAAHPRAASAVRRAKAAGGLLALVVTAILASRAGLSDFDVGLRALVAGAAGYLVCWALALQVARHLVVAEARAAGRLLAERGRERAERIAAAAAAAAGDARNGSGR